MSNNKMLIDATHPEETRVVVLRGGRVEEFDYESAARKLLRGNIYLAKVTRVEPSLQAAFVDYGGNRHGFLAFNEIHPDYYQIPMADRQALLDEEAAAEAAEEAAVDARAEAMARRRETRRDRSGRDGDGGRRDSSPHAHRDTGEDEAGREGDDDQSRDDHDDQDDDQAPETIESAHPGDDHRPVDEADTPSAVEEPDHETHAVAEATGMIDEVVSEALPPETVGGFAPDHNAEEQAEEGNGRSEAESVDTGEVRPQSSNGEEARARGNGDGGVQEVNGSAEAETVEQVGAEDALEELPSRPRRRPRSYKIQEVIKRRQVILVQVVKEERGNKGAALTTYLSLAGRYTVLMPNTARGGGISRKITNPQDRKRLKAIAVELEVPEGMGLIIRTAGAARTKQEIKRDFEYLLRLWESVRELTLQSVAPSLVYEEGNLIKRSIRDLYNKDVEEIVVAGDVAHHEAKDFMRMLMPSHAKNVIEYREPEPLFTRYQIERQLNAMFSPYVTLRSGGYLVINQTEALVAIDVNSGKATREFSIEETALNTNLEASDEIARQLKLRDLAGLIVIDFIDMEEKRNNRAVERRLKDALRFDRARIQVGRISHFGLMEMSRQRLRTGVLEGSTSQCPHCQGTGIIRSTESVALAVLRGLEDAVMAGARSSLIANTTATVALYILNNKRPFIVDMERRLGQPIVVQASDKMQGANFTIEKGAAPVVAMRRPDRTAVNMEWGFEGESETDADSDAAPQPDYADEDESEPRVEQARDHDRDRGDRDRGDRDRDEDGGERRGRRRRRRRGRRGERGDEQRLDTGPRGDTMRSEGDDEGARGEADDFAGDRAEADEVSEITEVGGDGYEPSAESDATAGDVGEGEERRERRGRRRGRRGGRRGRERGERQAGSEGGQETAASQGDDAEAPLGSAEGGGAPADGGEPATAYVEPTEGVEAAPMERPAKGRPTAAERKLAAVPEAPAPAVETQPETAPAPRNRHDLTTSEPRLARVVVGPNKAQVGGAESIEEAAKPTKKGWWQRKFGG
jgi:ribonuclease E